MSTGGNYPFAMYNASLNSVSCLLVSATVKDTARLALFVPNRLGDMQYFDKHDPSLVIGPEMHLVKLDIETIKLIQEVLVSGSMSEQGGKLSGSFAETFNWFFGQFKPRQRVYGDPMGSVQGL